jgi:hypothetical protein
MQLTKMALAGIEKALEECSESKWFLRNGHWECNEPTDSISFTIFQVTSKDGCHFTLAH